MASLPGDVATCTRTCTPVYRHKYTHVATHKQTLTCTCTHTYTLTHSHTHTCLHVCLFVFVCLCVCVCVCVRTCVHCNIVYAIRLYSCIHLVSIQDIWITSVCTVISGNVHFPNISQLFLDYFPVKVRIFPLYITG